MRTQVPDLDPKLRQMQPCLQSSLLLSDRPTRMGSRGSEAICLLLSKSPKCTEGKRAPLGLTTTRALSRTLPDLTHLQVALSVKHKLLAMYPKCMFKATI